MPAAPHGGGKTLHVPHLPHPLVRSHPRDNGPASRAPQQPFVKPDVQGAVPHPWLPCLQVWDAQPRGHSLRGPQGPGLAVSMSKDQAPSGLMWPMRWSNMSAPKTSGAQAPFLQRLPHVSSAHHPPQKHTVPITDPQVPANRRGGRREGRTQLHPRIRDSPGVPWQRPVVDGQPDSG